MACDTEKGAAHLDAVGADVERNKGDEALREQLGDHLADAAEASNDDMVPQLPGLLLVWLQHLHARPPSSEPPQLLGCAYLLGERDKPREKLVALSSRLYGGSDQPRCMALESGKSGNVAINADCF